MKLDLFLAFLDEHLDDEPHEDSEVTIRQVRKALGHRNPARDPIGWAKMYGIPLTRTLETSEGVVAFARRQHVIDRFKAGVFETSLARSNAQRDRFEREAKKREQQARAQAPKPAPVPAVDPSSWAIPADDRSLVATKRFETLQAELAALSEKIDFLVAKVNALCRTWDVPASRDDKAF